MALIQGLCQLFNAPISTSVQRILPPHAVFYPAQAAMSDFSHLSTEQPIDIEELRQRLAKMTDAELRKFGGASRFMCSPGANFGIRRARCLSYNCTKPAVNGSGGISEHIHPNARTYESFSFWSR
jgi:hypothetical protein